MRRISAKSCGLDARGARARSRGGRAVRRRRGRLRSPRLRGDLLAKQREQLERFGLAQDQGIADDRVAADGAAPAAAGPCRRRGRRRAGWREGGAAGSSRPRRSRHRHAAAACDVERQLAARPGCRAGAPASARRRSQSTAPLRGQGRIERDADPAGQPVQMLLRGARRISQQVRGGHAILERRQHRLEVGEEAVEEVGRGGCRPVERDRVRLAAAAARPGRSPRPAAAMLCQADRRGSPRPGRAAGRRG